MMGHPCSVSAWRAVWSVELRRRQRRQAFLAGAGVVLTAGAAFASWVLMGAALL